MYNITILNIYSTKHFLFIKIVFFYIVIIPCKIFNVTYIVTLYIVLYNIYFCIRISQSQPQNSLLNPCCTSHLLFLQCFTVNFVYYSPRAPNKANSNGHLWGLAARRCGSCHRGSVSIWKIKHNHFIRLYLSFLSHKAMFLNAYKCD